MNAELMVNLMLLMALLVVLADMLFPCCHNCKKIKLFTKGVTFLNHKEEIAWRCNTCEEEE